MSGMIPDSDNKGQTPAQSSQGSLSYGPVPPPFDPLANGGNVAPVVGNSVVPDLMRVYECLTQSKTPDVPPQNIAQQQDEGSYNSNLEHIPKSYDTSLHHTAVSYKQHVPYMEQSKQGQVPEPVTGYPYSNQCWTYDTTSIPMPQPPVPALPPSHSYQLSMQPPPPPQVSQSSGNRSVRKRGSPPINDDGNANANDDSSCSISSGKGGSKKRRNGGKGKVKDEKKKDDGEKKKEDGEKKKEDGRWSKRFTWPEELHRDFVAAIFDVGLKHSSPATVLEHMAPHEQITTERVKSHLQKYRLHRQKSKQDFMTDYEATMRRLKQSGYAGIDSLSGGMVAGHLAYATLTNQTSVPPRTKKSASSENDKKEETKNDSTDKAAAITPDAAWDQPQPNQQQFSQEMLVLPRLTEDEKRSPIGASMGYLMGLFFSLKQQLNLQRQQRQLQEADVSATAGQTPAHEQGVAAAVYDSFVQPPPQFDPSMAHMMSIPNPMAVVAQGQIPAGANMSSPQGPAVPHSTRSNLEQNNLMKQEMKNQMAFQNKMRALKQQELNKYKAQYAQATLQQQQHPHPPQQQHPSQQHHHHQQPPSTIGPPLQSPQQQHVQQQDTQQGYQGAGETAADHNSAQNGNTQPRPYSLSLGDEEEFWNTDVVDEQLFQFLMNN